MTKRISTPTRRIRLAQSSFVGLGVVTALGTTVALAQQTADDTATGQTGTTQGGITRSGDDDDGWSSDSESFGVAPAPGWSAPGSSHANSAGS